MGRNNFGRAPLHSLLVGFVCMDEDGLIKGSCGNNTNNKSIIVVR